MHRVCCDCSASHRGTGWSALLMGLKRLGSRVAPKHGEHVIIACAPSWTFVFFPLSHFLSHHHRQVPTDHGPRVQMLSVGVFEHLSMSMSRSKELTAGPHPAHVEPTLGGTTNNQPAQGTDSTSSPWLVRPAAMGFSPCTLRCHADQSQPGGEPLSLTSSRWIQPRKDRIPPLSARSLDPVHLALAL
ncbi:hypothetical protein F5883DRAFT_550923 [Diaporthe sp. PMI_573]|nr:hypothetical protein F5883DRAFT_550923 [Diaporthaceae sp. PMI_573]